MQVQVRHQPSFAVARCVLGPGEPLRVESGAMLASSWGVQVEASMQGGLLKGLKRAALGGESLFVTTYSAPQGGGWVDVVDLGPGEAVTVDSGHVVAYDAGVQSRLRRAVEGRSVQSLKSGEGFVFDFSGPGRVMIQTRNPRALIDWLTAELPFSRN